MDLSKYNEAIAYIEKQLTGEINIDRAGEIAGCSAFHFSKIFLYLTDMTLKTYIRNRRMTLACYDLQKTDEKVIDLALKYGYESPTAFNRAFKKVHGVAPSKVKQKKVSLNYHEPITLNIEIKGNRNFTYTIEEKETFRIVGVKEKYAINIEDNFNKVPIQWFKATVSGKIKKILSLNDQEEKRLLGVSVFDDDGMFSYYIAAESDQEKPKNFDEYVVEKNQYAVFQCVGAVPKALQQLQKNIITDWLPASGYEYANAPDIEVYYEGNRNDDDYRCEVWLPVKDIKERT
jgi:AraC family transcriptional regulator